MLGSPEGHARVRGRRAISPGSGTTCSQEGTTSRRAVILLGPKPSPPEALPVLLWLPTPTQIERAQREITPSGGGGQRPGDPSSSGGGGR